MAIVVNNPSDTKSGTNGSDVASWMIALVIVVVLVLGAIYLLPRLASAPAAAPQAPGANIQVTLPSNPSNNSGAGAGEAGGAQQ